MHIQRGSEGLIVPMTRTELVTDGYGGVPYSAVVNMMYHYERSTLSAAVL